MHNDLTPFDANLLWGRKSTTYMEAYGALSIVYYEWIVGLIDGAWHLQVSDAKGNLTPMGVYPSLDEAKSNAEHFELWEWEFRSWANRVGGLADFPLEDA